jgi:hypothetical protein
VKSFAMSDDSVARTSLFAQRRIRQRRWHQGTTQLLEAFAQIASKLPPPKLVYDAE